MRAIQQTNIKNIVLAIYDCLIISVGKFIHYLCLPTFCYKHNENPSEKYKYDVRI